ncbi:MAG: hypothetical protein IJC21_02050, partial [Lentisphaeria bacterium]|nr:hypothetical protein [Lentisphaeria bacterium]
EHLCSDISVVEQLRFTVGLLDLELLKEAQIVEQCRKKSCFHITSEIVFTLTNILCESENTQCMGEFQPDIAVELLISCKITFRISDELILVLMKIHI